MRPLLGGSFKTNTLSFTERQRQHNYFEYRYDDKDRIYFLFNPVTGEKILQTNYDHIDRSQSLWCEPTMPRYIAGRDESRSNIRSIILNPVPYQSRRKCRYRRFYGWKNEITAANYLVTVARGFLARQRVRKLIRQRYCKIFDPTMELYYFQDNHNQSAETSWYKPRLAYVDDILTNNILDPEDYMRGNKYSHSSGIHGPYYALKRFGKANKVRSNTQAFIPDNPLRSIAVTKHREINIENCTIGTVISWLDSSAVKDVVLSEYEYIRTAESSNDWNDILRAMKRDEDNLYLQLYGFFAFSKHEVPTDRSGLLEVDAELAMDRCLAVITDQENTYNLTLKVFAMYALHNILSTTAGRTEYFNISAVTEMGEGRHLAIETYIGSKIVIFNKYLVKINFEVEDPITQRAILTGKGSKRPTRRSADLIELSFICLSDLSNQNEYREQMAYLTAQSSIYALKTCAEETGIMLNGLKYLYHLCYRCESGQEVLLSCDVGQVLKLAHINHAGDPVVMHQCRRLELALQPDGWRGNVEDHMYLHRGVDDTHTVHSANLSNDPSTLKFQERLRQQYEESNVGSPMSRLSHTSKALSSPMSHK